jgi:hypothetical protein
MSAGRDETNGGKAVEQALRRQASSAEFRRDLTRMPQFRIETDLPDDLIQLLGQIERAERRHH